MLYKKMKLCLILQKKMLVTVWGILKKNMRKVL